MTDQPKWTLSWSCIPGDGELAPFTLLVHDVVLRLGVHAVQYQLRTPLYDNADEMLPILVPALAEKARQKESQLLQQLYSQMH